MEAFCGDTEDGTEDISGPRKSRIKSLRARLFGKSKRSSKECDGKHSQSASDIYTGKALGSDENLAIPQGMMGSRALSHESIFSDGHVLTDEEPMRVLSQENVHSKIKALQLKLQQQKMHLGPPPLILPVRQQDNVGGLSEDSSSPLKLPEISATVDVSTYGPLSKAIFQPTSSPLSPVFKPPASKSRPTTPSPTFTLSTLTATPSCESPLDFSSSVQYIPCLDTSAARHRMSVKPRNQRASTKRRVVKPDCKVDNLNSHTEHATDLRPKLEALEKRQDVTSVSITSPHFLPKSSKPDPLSLEAAPKSFTIPEQVLQGRLSPISSQVLQVKPQRHGFGTSSERQHSILEMKETTGDSVFRVKTHDKSYILRKTEPSDSENVSTSCGSMVSKSSPVCPQDYGETDSIRGIKRPGSGSFHFSITSAKSHTEDRPRSGSFAGGSRHNVGAEAIAPLITEEHKDPQLIERSFTMGILRQNQKSSVLPWERQNSLENVESETVSKTINPSEVVEAKEEVMEEGKTVFGFKFRSTSNSMRFWSDGSSRRHSKSSEEKSDGLKRQESRDIAVNEWKNTTVGDFPLTDPILPSNAPALSTEARTTASSDPSPEIQSAPQTTSSEVSWVTLAMEKTRSLQQLFAKRFPKDFTGGQTTMCPQTPAQLPKLGEGPNGKQVKSHTVRLQECVKPVQGDGGKDETEQSRTISRTWTEPQVPRAQPVPLVVSHPSVPTNKCAIQSPLHASPPPENPSLCGPVTPSLARSCPTSGPSSWSYQGHQPVPILPKPTTSAQTCTDKEESTLLENESPSLLGKRAEWAGSVSEKAAFLERRAEWTTGVKGVQLKEPQMEASKPSGEPFAETKPQGREGFKLTGTQSPTRVPLEEKWMRKNLAPSLSPSSSPTLAPALRSMPDSGQPSWMELAKRKSMAWSDKTMD